jgi:CHAT domain-containing protein/Flp pilus assembly protein TadD
VEGQDWLSKALGDEGAKKKAANDSIDFQFAMSVNESSGFFDVEQKGEGWSRGLYSFRQETDKTLAEKARESLEIGIGFYQWRKHRLAESSFLETKLFMETNGLTADINYLRCTSNLGLVYLIQGNTMMAEDYIKYSLETSELNLGKESPGYAANLNSRAKLDQLVGKYNEAEALFTEAEKSVAVAFGDKSMQYAIVVNNKAMLYQAIGRYDEAITLLQKAISIVESAPKKFLEGKKSFDARRFQSNLALLYQLKGDYPKAESFFLGLKKTFENRGQASNNEYAILCNQLSTLYMQMGKYDLVEALLKKSEKIYKSKFTEESPPYAKVQNDLGTFYRVKKDYGKAEGALTKALGIRQRTLSENHPDYVKSLENLGILYWKMGDLPKAYPLLKDAMQKSLSFIHNYFPPMSEAEKTKYWDVLQPRFQRFYNYAIEASATNPAVLEDVYNYQIATKALLLNSTNKIKKAILASGDKKLIADYLSWISQKETLARYYALSREELSQQKIDLTELEKQSNDMERSLSSRSTDFTQAYATEEITYQKVQAQLQPAEALIEVIRVRQFDEDFTDDARYMVLVLTKEKPTPQLIVLENGKKMDSYYAKLYKNTILQRLDDETSYEQYWSKIDPLVAGKKTLYLSPDGVYNQLNVNTLKPAEGGDYVIKKYNVVVIGNSKDLMAIKTRKPARTKKDAFLLGFPDYGGNAVALPGTKVEIDQINKILKTSGYLTSQQTQKEASEAKIKSQKSPTLMHIATHGYFLADADLKGGDALGIDADNAKDNPLLRSGLLLAGMPSPTQQQAPDLQSNDNGILTAYEAMNLSLEGTELIVLSACETGLGDVRAGEGVYGLQRAFLVAGANALVMSLWKVDDAATQQLMTSFYTQWAKTGNKSQAFKQAQLQLMTKYPEPYFWGAFVMMGM